MYSEIDKWREEIDQKLPLRDDVLERNKAITSEYSKMYRLNPKIYKWAGMAAFASFHMGEQMHTQDWKSSDIMNLEELCNKGINSQQENFQLIRIINNKIFNDIGWVHIAYCDERFEEFESMLSQEGNYDTILGAFQKLNRGRKLLDDRKYEKLGERLVWEANCDILWHEQADVVQPLFDQLSKVFSLGMTFCASFDYQINNTKTDWKTHSSFIFYMLFHGFDKVWKNGFVPDVTNLEHRWHWIDNKLLEIWKDTEGNKNGIMDKMEKLVRITKFNNS